MKNQNPYNAKPGVKGILREMLTDHPEEYRSPEEIDADLPEVELERLEQKEEDERILDYIEVGSERESRELIDAKETLLNLQAGCLILSCILQLGSFFVGVWWQYCIGNVIGLGLAEVMVTWMYRTIEKVMDMDPGTAWKQARNQAMLRYFTILAVFIVVCLVGDEWMVLGTALSMLTMKFSAYLQKITGRILKKLGKGR